jgi:rsbT antagonist protein RsbS
MDSHMCALISRLAAAAGLMGAETVMCGLNPDIATTLQAMGLELPGVRTERSLEDALERLGIGPVPDRDAAPEQAAQPDLPTLADVAKSSRGA